MKSTVFVLVHDAKYGTGSLDQLGKTRYRYAAAGKRATHEFGADFFENVSFWKKPPGAFSPRDFFFLC